MQLVLLCQLFRPMREANFYESNRVLKCICQPSYTGQFRRFSLTALEKSRGCGLQLSKVREQTSCLYGHIESLKRVVALYQGFHWKDPSVLGC